MQNAHRLFLTCGPLLHIKRELQLQMVEISGGTSLFLAH